MMITEAYPRVVFGRGQTPLPIFFKKPHHDQDLKKPSKKNILDTPLNDNDPKSIFTLI